MATTGSGNTEGPEGDAMTPTATAVKPSNQTPDKSSQRAAPASDGALGAAGEPEQAVRGSASAGSVLLDAEEEWDDEGLVGGDKEFRRRRLTFAAQGKMSSNVNPPEPAAMTVYRALELGEEDAKQTTPFPASVLGIYSCHGAEPGWEEGEEDLAKINQDRACVVHPFMGSNACALLCVFDGHGERGDMVSNFVMNEIPTRLAKHPRIMDNPTLALEDTFEEVDRALVEVALEDEQVYSGTTAVVALYRDGCIWVANAGDSRAVLATRSEEGGDGGTMDGGSEGTTSLSRMTPVALSEDHNPDRPGELQRIERSGGFVSPPPEQGLSARVWLDQEMTRIGLAMARSIGDHAVKDAGVIATPEVMTRTVTADDAFIVLASDGVWEFMNNKEVVDLVHDCLKRGGGREAAEACAELISVSAARWRQFEGAYRDDISCIVLRLPCFDRAAGKEEGAGAKPGLGPIAETGGGGGEAATGAGDSAPV